MADELLSPNANLLEHSKQSKVPRTLKTCKQQNVDETQECRATTAAPTQPISSEAKGSKHYQNQMLEFETRTMAAKLS